MNTVLIVDDEKGIRDVLGEILADEGYKVLTADEGYAGLKIVESNDVDLVLLDIWLPQLGGIEVLEQIKANSPDIEVVVISGHANIDLAVKAVKLGAYDFLEKPLSLDRVTTVVKNALALEQLRRENRILKNQLVNNDEMVGQSPAFKRIQELIGQSAGSDSRIMIYGENGTGKELVAREIHRRSSRSSGPFVEVNCAAIPETLIESELFGHEKGAFTSAVSGRRGKFEAADGGTLFLDEIADMSLAAQAKVLRAIQEMRFERIGGDGTIEVDVRVVAATNKDIREEVQAGRFREDLYFRLNVIWIDVPPLRDRPEDIPLLARYFLGKHQEGETQKRLTNDALSILKRHSWPGNVRELKNFIERITIMADEEELTGPVVSRFIDAQATETDDPVLDEFDGMGLNEARDTFEKRYLESKLRDHGFNISQTATDLGIYPSNLHAKIKKYGIQVER